jgi:hypothetical protein
MGPAEFVGAETGVGRSVAALFPFGGAAFALARSFAHRLLTAPHRPPAEKIENLLRNPGPSLE